MDVSRRDERGVSTHIQQLEGGEYDSGIKRMSCEAICNLFTLTMSYIAGERKERKRKGLQMLASQR